MKKHYSFIAEEQDLRLRLDKVLVKHFPDKTRHFLQKLFKEKLVLINGKPAKSNTLLSPEQKVDISIPEPKPLQLQPKNIPLDIIFEDKDLLVVNKPAGIVTHPGVGETHIEDSLVNAILYHCKGTLSGISGVMRPGIIHRLDKDTSGLLIIAKNDQAHQFLAEQMKERKIEKTYLTLLAGSLKPAQGSIEAPIGRSSTDRKKMAITSADRGKTALTHYKVLEYFKKDIQIEPHYSYTEVRLITGRTHQIRVHFSSIGFPVVGDPLYGRENLNNFFIQKTGLKRQFLHAAKLSFVLPSSRTKVSFSADLPEDLKKLLKWMEKSEYTNL